MAIRFVRGDATQPEGSNPRFIIHIVNDAGGWGAGFVVALSRRWSEPEKCYRQWHREGSLPRCGKFELGNVQAVMAEPGLWVVNMIAQTGYGRSGTTQHREGADGEAPRPPIRYEALEACLQKVARSAKVLGVSIHMPRIGCSLAGGQWSKVQPIIEKTLVSIDAVVYDFPGSSFNP